MLLLNPPPTYQAGAEQDHPRFYLLPKKTSTFILKSKRKRLAYGQLNREADVTSPTLLSL